MTTPSPIYRFCNLFYRKLGRGLLPVLIFVSLQRVAFGAEEPQISLITCDSGQELYSIYGHSALRVRWPESSYDLIYNFGLFDFSTPHFYWKFIRGNLNYMLGVQSMEEFIFQYRIENRGVVEQQLNLDAIQTAQIVSRLNFLSLPENRLYRYRFLRKNCTTELRDLIFGLLSPQELAATEKGSSLTHRELLNTYTQGWTKFGLNLILGSTIDRKISIFEEMFLPETLYRGLIDVENQSSPLVTATTHLFTPSIESKGDHSQWKSVWGVVLSPTTIFSLLLLLTTVSLYRGRSPLFSNLLLIAFGAAGLFLLGATSITLHSELFWNYNLLWCNPLLLPLVILSLFGKKKIERALCALSTLMLALLLLLWSIKVQYFEWSYLIAALSLSLILLQRLFAPSLFKRG